MKPTSLVPMAYVRRPAADVQLVMVVADLAPTGPATLAETTALPNDVGPTGIMNCGSEEPVGGIGPLGPQNVVLGLSYRDPVANRRFMQLQALYWRGDGQDHDLYRATTEAKYKMLHRFEGRLGTYADDAGGITKR